ncbi:hypothetical protein ColLi_05347 [Colletotrichum liriopes]|uniref:Uncharacterized protein n=1 Tax=Colletotrichum liriopes TaxID=708192 RepID=A0AA37LRQ3_9PEZI|nr:hypothetical protein ColLi_05347 [Colletotrichum liriopes]
MSTPPPKRPASQHQGLCSRDYAVFRFTEPKRPPQRDRDMQNPRVRRRLGSERATSSEERPGGEGAT